jgi:2-phosphosulfolactate phosphatase
MDRTLNVYSLPSYVHPEDLAGGTVVVIDVLRASTTIIHALAAGAREVVPCLEVEDARAEAERMLSDRFVLGGERGGLTIEGFDLGNTPTDYTPDMVGGKTVVFTTTNGTRALLHCQHAERVFIGAFANASAVIRKLLSYEKIHILCAGTQGEISRDDILVAGMLVEWFQRRCGLEYRLNAQAIVARENWTSAFAMPYSSGAEPIPPELLATQLRNSPGGRNLIEVGLDEDIVTASRVDQFDLVPELDLRTFRITCP